MTTNDLLTLTKENDMTIIPLLDRLDAAESAVVRAPRRFDVHEVPPLEAWASEQRAAGIHRLVVDCSDVVFIDLAAVTALEGLGATHGANGASVELAWPSTAVRVTLELLGHDVAAEAVAA